MHYLRKASSETKMWSQSGSNRRHLACKASALPAELWPRRNLTCLPCRLRETASVTSFSRHPGKLGLIVLQAKQLVGLEGLEPSTSPLSGVRSNHLSYRPKVSFRVSTSSQVSQSHLENLLPEFSSIEVSCVVVRTKHLFHNHYSVTVFLLKRR